MKRVLRIVILGPMLLLFFAFMVLCEPLYHFAWWLTEDEPYESQRTVLWHELMDDLLR